MRDFSNVKRVVVKIGSSTLTHPSGLLNIRCVEALVKVLADIKNSGRELVLVSSGAQAVALGKLGLAEKPKDTKGKQAIAAVGQCELMYLYDKLFSEYNHVTAQILLTREDVDNPVRKQNLQNTFHRLLEMNILPIVNENDSVATEEIEAGGSFGDNDTLSAVVSVLIEADLLILLSDIDGLYTDNPRTNPDAQLIPCVERLTPEIEAMASGAGSARGTGGMVTKIRAAQLAVSHGVEMLILNGANPNDLYRLLDGEEVGTWFMAPHND